MFAGFDYDTVDYRKEQTEGIPLELLAQYKVIVWYTDITSAARSGSKFSNTPGTALRLINSKNQLNTLAVYLKQQGNVWLFGEGTTSAIANGYWDRFGGGVATIPYNSGEGTRDILRLGDFLYDFIHLRSQLYTGGLSTSPSLTLNQQLKGCIPYLPQFAGPASNTDRTHDPRIGPSAERNVPLWNDLPRLTIAPYRSANTNPDLRSVSLTYFISQPLFITEGTGADFHSTLDTLYLFQARSFDPNRAQLPPSDGFPNAVYYHGSDNGKLVWFGFAMYYFELDQARQVARSVLRNFGIAPKAGPPSGPHAYVSQTAAMRPDPVHAE
jgi:hypothetical protein